MSKDIVSAATTQKKAKYQNEHIRKQTETEVISVIIPYVTPSPSDTTEVAVLQDDTQEELQDDASSDSEAKTEIVINTSEKNSWV